MAALGWWSCAEAVVPGILLKNTGYRTRKSAGDMLSLGSVNIVGNIMGNTLWGM